MNGFYQPNWQGIFGPSLDRYQQQAQQSNQPRQGLGFGMGMGNGGGLGGMFRNFMQQAARGRGIRNGLVDPYQQQQQGGGFAQEQAVAQEAAQRGLNMNSGAGEWQQGHGNNMQQVPGMPQGVFQTTPQQPYGGADMSQMRNAGNPEQNQAAMRQMLQLQLGQMGGGLGNFMRRPLKRLTR